MKKIARILSLILVLSMLVCAFAACKGDGDDVEESSESSSYKSSSSKTPTVSHKVTVKDGLTGAVLESADVPDGRGSASFIGHYEELHYGYRLNSEKTNEEYNKKIFEDTEIVLEFEPLPIYTVYLQNANGELFTFETDYEFKRALTPKEMGTVASPGLNSLDERYVFGNGKDITGRESEEGRNDYVIEPLSNCIKMYEGYNIVFDSIPKAPAVFNGDFASWAIVEGYDGDFTSGEIVKDTFFNGAGLTGDLVVRAKYTESGTGAMADAKLAELASTPEVIFANLVKNIEQRGSYGQTDAYYDTEYKNGNEKLKYGDEKTYIGKGTDTTFKFATGMGSFMYTVDKSLQTSDPVVNKFNGTEAMAELHVDQNTYIAFDGRYMYALVIARDETPIYTTDEDTQVLNLKKEAGETYNMYYFTDCIEIRYNMGISNKYTDLPQNDFKPKYDPVTGIYSGGELDHNSTAENSMRTMIIDRAGTYYQTSNDAHSLKQSDFVELIDLAPNDDTRMTAKLSGAENSDNGYAVGVRFDVQGYIDAINADDNPNNDFSWDTTAGKNTNIFGIAFIVQVNDRQESLKRYNELGDPVESSAFDVSNGISKDSPRYSTSNPQTLLWSDDVVSGGVQRDLDEIELFRLAQVPVEE